MPELIRIPSARASIPTHIHHVLLRVFVIDLDSRAVLGAQYRRGMVRRRVIPGQYIPGTPTFLLAWNEPALPFPPIHEKRVHPVRVVTPGGRRLPPSRPTGGGRGPGSRS